MSDKVEVRESAKGELEELLAKVKSKAPQEAEKISSLVKAMEEKHLGILGEDEVFKLRDQSGEIRAFREVLHLSANEGTLVQPVPKGPYVISAQGYEKWEAAAGAITMKPPQVLVGDTMRENPHIERDHKTNRITAIHCRTIAFRFTSKGIPQVSDWQTIFDVPAYRLIDLLAKAKAYPQAFRLLPNGVKPDAEPFQAKIKLWTDASEPQKFREETVNPTWAPYPFDEATTFWVCTSHPEAIQWYAQIINREKKAIDFAQTFSKRNALKHLSGLQRVPGQEPNKAISSWNISVTSWRPTSGSLIKWDLTRYSQVQKALVSASKGDTSVLQIGAGEERVSDDPEAGETELKEMDRQDGDSFEEEEPPISVGEGQVPPSPESPKESAKAPQQEPPHRGRPPKEPKPTPPPPPPPPPPPRPPEAPPKKMEPAGEDEYGPYMTQLRVFQKMSAKIYDEACKNLDMKPMSESGAKKVLDEINRIIEK